MNPMLWLNGRLLPASHSDASVPVSDAGLLLGDGVFETLRTFGGRPFGLDEHYRRLCAGASVFELGVPTEAEVATAIDDLLKANSLGTPGTEARIRITVTGGDRGLIPIPGQSSRPNVLITANRLAEVTGNASVVNVPFTRNPTSATAGIKTTSYAENALALRYAKTRRADEAILSDTRGNLSEGATSNLFVVLDGRLVTPPLTTGCLPGVTRSQVIQGARGAGIEVHEEKAPIDALATADEAFLTSSLRGVQPILAVNNTPLSTCPGPVTEACAAALAKLLPE